MTGIADAPPALSAERAVLGAMMLPRSPHWDVTSILDPADFADWRHETIYRAITGILSSGQPVDPITVTDRLAADRELDRVGGVEVLHRMTSDVPTASNVGYYAEIVKAAATRRRIAEAAESIRALVADNGIPPDELADRAASLVTTATGDHSRDMQMIGDGAVADAFASMNAPREYLLTPWRELNDVLVGLHPGTLNVIGARPGSGKTIFGLQLAAYLATHGVPAAFMSLEMPTRALILRLIAAGATINLSSLIRGDLAPDQIEAASQARRTLETMPLLINDRAGLNVHQIAAFARAAYHRHRIRLLVVDYIQLIAATDPRKPRWETVGQITAGLQNLARELNIPVVALAQLNREAHGRLPGLSDLRESGNIEQDAHSVILLQRGDDDDDDPASAPDELTAVVAKNRQGPPARAITLLWQGHYARIRSFGDPTGMGEPRDPSGVRGHR